MSPSPIRAHVNRDVMRWAREAAGLDPETAAKKLAVAPTRVGEWESGERSPTVGQLRKMAHVYGRTPAFFFRPTPPDDDLPRPPDYRSGSKGAKISFGLRRQLREAMHRRDSLLELERDLITFEPPPVGASETLSAANARSDLGVSLTDQFGATSLYEMLAIWTRALERKGVLVFQSSDFDTKEARGISIALNPLPVVLLSGKDAVAGKIFTLLHEYFHVTGGTGGLCNDLNDSIVEEQRCNALAAETLMPLDAFVDEFARTERSVQVVADRFKVSKLSAAIRLQRNDLISEDALEAVRHETDIAVEAKAAQKGGPVPVHTMRLRDLGLLYSGAVLDAYHRDEITLTDASQLLKTKVRHFPKIEEALRRRAETA